MEFSRWEWDQRRGLLLRPLLFFLLAGVGGGTMRGRGLRAFVRVPLFLPTIAGVIPGGSLAFGFRWGAGAAFRVMRSGSKETVP